MSERQATYVVKRFEPHITARGAFIVSKMLGEGFEFAAKVLPVGSGWLICTFSRPLLLRYETWDSGPISEADEAIRAAAISAWRCYNQRRYPPRSAGN